MQVRRVYLAGPPYAEEYRRRAAVPARAQGWEAVDPMRRDYRGRTEGKEAEIVEGDLADLESCDAVLAAFTHPDEGTAMEAWHARAQASRSSPTRAARRRIRGRCTSPTRSAPTSRRRFARSGLEAQEILERLATPDQPG